MRLIRSLVSASSFAASILGIQTVDRGMKPARLHYEMDQYDSPLKQATWMKAIHVDGPDEPSWDQLYRYASSGFNYVVSRTVPADRNTNFGSFLVSAFWNPEDQHVYLATKAKGGFKTRMHNICLKNKEAPVWASRTQNTPGTTLIENDEYHAEDTAYYVFEFERSSSQRPFFKSKDNPVSDDDFLISQEGVHARTVLYPRGSKIATWGYHVDHSDEVKQKGIPLKLCDRAKDKRESCTRVAKELGVTYAFVSGASHSKDDTAPGSSSVGSDIDVDSEYSDPRWTTEEVEGMDNAENDRDADMHDDDGLSDPEWTTEEVDGMTNGPSKRWLGRNVLLRNYPRQPLSCSWVPKFNISNHPLIVHEHPEPFEANGGKSLGVRPDNSTATSHEEETPQGFAGTNSSHHHNGTAKTSHLNDSGITPVQATTKAEAATGDDNDKTTKSNGSISSATKTITSKEAPKTTEAPQIPQCGMQNAIPDRYTSAFCRCTLGDETKTLPLLTIDNPKVMTESCHYKSMPTGTSNPVTEVSVTYTLGCRVCAGPGGANEHKDDQCESIPGCAPPIPTFEVTLSDTNLLVGTAFNEDDGDEIAAKLAKELREHCGKPSVIDEEGKCDTSTFDIADVAVILDEGFEYMVLEANVDYSIYNSTVSRDWLISALVASLTESIRASDCPNFTYKDTPIGGSGCSDRGVQKRNPPPPEIHWDEETGERQLRKRIPPSDPGTTPSLVCNYSAEMCAGPKSITVVLGTEQKPTLNKLDVTFNLRKKEHGFNDPVAQFFCEAVISVLAAVAMKYMPKVPGFEVLSEVEDFGLEAVCGKT